MKWVEEYLDSYENWKHAWLHTWKGPDGNYFHADYPARFPPHACEFYEGCMKYSDGWIEYSLSEWAARMEIMMEKRKYKVLLNEIQFTTLDFIEFMSAKKVLEEELDTKIGEIKKRVGKSEWDFAWDWPYNF